MMKIDYKKEYKDLYKASSKKVDIVDVPEMNFLMIDGMGDPNTSQDFQDAAEALYSVSFTIKFTVKKSGEADYVVMPLEGLWWMEDMAEFSMENKESWLWTLMIMQPESVTEDLVKEAIEQVGAKKELPALSKIRLASFIEGKAAQIMHIGPYAEEGPTNEKLYGFIMSEGYELRGKHHEIYLSDPRRAKPEKMKTIIRHPIS